MKNFKFTKGLLVGLIIGFSLSIAISTFANSTIKQVYFNNDIKVQVEGTTIYASALTVITDDSPNGTTYLPLRKIAEAVGKSVNWDNTTKTANITEKEVTNTTMSNTTTTTNNTITTYQKDGLTIYTINNVDYVYLSDIVKIHNFAGIFYDSDNKKLTYKNLVIPFISYRGKSYVPYDYYINTLIPVVKQ